MTRADLLWVEVLLSLGVFGEELASTMTEQLVVSHLQLKRARIPGVVQFNVVRMNEGEFLVYR